MTRAARATKRSIRERHQSKDITPVFPVARQLCRHPPGAGPRSDAREIARTRQGGAVVPRAGRREPNRELVRGRGEYMEMAYGCQDNLSPLARGKACYP